MIFWIIGLSLWTVWFVFHDPAIDLRMVIIGAVLPALIHVSWIYTPLRSVVVVATLMGIVMLATMHQRKWRRRLIFVVFGMFLSIVFDGAWANTEVFWWPLSSHDFISDLHPDRSTSILLLQEAVGLGLTIAFLTRMHVFEEGNGRYFINTGRLPIDVGRPVTFGRKAR